MLSNYKDSFRLFRANFWLIIIAALLLELGTFFIAMTGTSSAAHIVPQLLIALLFHQIVLYEDVSMKGKQARKLPFGAFMWANAMLLIATVLIGFWILPVTMGFGTRFVISILILFLLLTVFGTSLPAAAAGDRYNPKISLVRAKVTWLSITGGLLTGPILLYIAFVICVGLLVNYLSLPVPRYGDPGNITLMGLVFAIAVQCSSLFLILMTIVVLCRAYLRVAPQHIVEEVNAGRQNSIKVLRKSP